MLLVTADMGPVHRGHGSGHGSTRTWVTVQCCLSRFTDMDPFNSAYKFDLLSFFTFELDY